mmetsp:Transcript_111703/g.249310  ORF Transcript_111703/g.249310 Transcript_111703/m.249310 type:complete len:253 (+) Transcript_111703:493-1251(+)
MASLYGNFDLNVADALLRTDLLLGEGENPGEVIVNDHDRGRGVRAHHCHDIRIVDLRIKDVYVELLVILVGYIIKDGNCDRLLFLIGIEGEAALEMDVVRASSSRAWASPETYRRGAIHGFLPLHGQRHRASTLKHRILFHCEVHLHLPDGDLRVRGGCVQGMHRVGLAQRVHPSAQSGHRPVQHTFDHHGGHPPFERLDLDALAAHNLSCRGDTIRGPRVPALVLDGDNLRHLVLCEVGTVLLSNLQLQFR